MVKSTYSVAEVFFSENSRRTREKPLVPRVRKRKTGVYHDQRYNRGTLIKCITIDLHDRDTFDFSQGRVTKNQPMAVLVWLSEGLGIQQFLLYSV